MIIVIIEDEHELGMLIRNFLQKQINSTVPSTIELFTSLNEGVNYIKMAQPDWIFIDNNLPDGKGINEIENIRTSQNGSKATKIVMMSAMTNLREEAFKKGVDYFLNKPISFTEVQTIFQQTDVNQ